MNLQVCLKSRYRITIVGDTKVGKKSLCSHLDEQTYFSPLERNGSYGYLPNGAAFNQADYNDESTLYIFIFLYDLSCQRSFTFALDLYEKIKKEIRLDFIALWVGNKRDLIDKGNGNNVREFIDQSMRERS
jgi:hypothetical protein